MTNPASEFWTPKTLEQLGESQDIASPQSLDDLIGFGAKWFDSDESFGQFLEALDPRFRAKVTIQQ